MDTSGVRPGDILLTQIGGPLGLVIRVAQALTGDYSRYTHVSIVLDDGTVMAGQPGGARIDPIERVTARGPVAHLVLELDDETRARIVGRARSYRGVPYSFLNYLSLLLVRFGVRPAWLLAFVAGTGHVICSQLADRVYSDVGVQLFRDGRFPGDVTPGDLAHVGTVRHLGTGPWRRPVVGPLGTYPYGADVVSVTL